MINDLMINEAEVQHDCSCVFKRSKIKREAVQYYLLEIIWKNYLLEKHYSLCNITCLFKQ